MNSIKTTCLVSTVFISIIGMTISCNNINRNTSHPEISNASIKEGEALAAVYCKSCHELPDPSLLSSITWEKGVLPAMGPRLGIFSWNGKLYPNMRSDFNLPRNFYPKQPVVKPEDWQKIIDYFVATAPDTLDVTKAGQRSIQMGLPLFASEAPHDTTSYPATTFVKIVHQGSLTEIITSDSTKKTVYRLYKSLHVIDSVKSRGPIVDVEL
ncbi:MAG: VCBS repeat-containing protein, partial [Chitinophagaceae bacterium]|nr:VCBS repeat-containing protein [Chitinophagaceae bacterium]